jgi:hypothetical protein
MDKVKVDIEEVRRLTARIKEINQIPFYDIEWVDGDKTLQIPAEVREDWKFCGLSNVTFLECVDYKKFLK